MQVFPSFENLTRADQYMFAQLFSQAEIEAGGWFIMNLYDRKVLVKLVQAMGGDASMVRSHADTEDTFFFAIVA